MELYIHNHIKNLIKDCVHCRLARPGVIIFISGRSAGELGAWGVNARFFLRKDNFELQ
jgi:hypothetical protein